MQKIYLYEEKSNNKLNISISIQKILLLQEKSSLAGFIFFLKNKGKYEYEIKFINKYLWQPLVFSL